jgi:uncharacterized protein
MHAEVFSRHRVHVQSFQDGRSALHIASLSGGGPGAACVSSILATAASSGLTASVLDVADNDGNTPLLLAARYGRLDACKVLVGAGASLTSVNKAGHSPMDAARQGGNPAVEDCLLDAL